MLYSLQEALYICVLTYKIPHMSNPFPQLVSHDFLQHISIPSHKNQNNWLVLTCNKD